MPQSITFQIQDIKCDHLPESPWPTRWVKKLFSVKLILDDIEYDTGPIKGSTTTLWSDKFSLQALGSSSFLEIEVHDHHLISKRIEVIGHSKDTVHTLLKESSSETVVRIRRTMSRHSGVELTFSIAFQDSNIYPPAASLEPPETPCTNNPASVNTIVDSDEHSNSGLLDQHPPVQDDSIGRRQRGDEIERAEQSIARLQPTPPITDKIESVVGGSAKLVDNLTPFAVSLGTLLDKIKPFVEIGDKLAEIHPYAKIAWSILSLVPKSIIAQRERDESLCNLMETIKDVHSFLAEVEPLDIIDSQRKIAEDMGRLTVESAHLIRHYTVKENFWKRVATLALSEATTKVQKIQDQMKERKEAFQLCAVAHVEIKVFQIEITAFQILDRTKDIDIDITLRDMPYGKGGRYNSRKGCLPGTRTAVLDELHRLINLPDSGDTPRLLVLTGVAGCGKSAIAHTVARHYHETKRLGSSVFFDRADQLQRHSRNLLSTVARDIANLDTRWEIALYDIVKKNDSLRYTNAIPDQIESFIIGPAQALSIIGPVVIVIDALDESGDSREDLIRSFMQRTSDLPSNFRILITAPSESGFSNNQHVKIIPIETLGKADIDGDIFKFIESKLTSIADMLERKLASVVDMQPTNSKQWCHSLVLASDHSFEWADTASRAILQGKDDDAQVKILCDIIRNKRALHDLYPTIRAGERKQDELEVIPSIKQPRESPSDQTTTTHLLLTPARAVAQLLHVPSVPPDDEITTVYPPVDPSFKSTDSTVHSIFEVIGFVQCMRVHPRLYLSKQLPETLASLAKTLQFAHRAIRAYQHTPLVQSLSAAISKEVEECRQVLNELQIALAHRSARLPSTIHFIQTYIWGGFGKGAPTPVRVLDSNLRKCHSSFVQRLLALGSAAWPELKRGLGKETLEELEIFYEELKQESTSLQHIKVDAVIVIDYLGRSLPVPMVFCMSQQDFHVVITGFCRGLAGDVLIRRGNYRIFNSEDDQAINPEEFAIILQPGMTVDMSIAFHEQAEDRQGSEGYSCPRCQHVNSRCTGWVTCAKCNGSFKISPEEESIVSPETEQHAGTDFLPNERSLFRKISIFQARAPNMGILLNREASKKSKIQPGELNADAETRQITEAQDDTQDVTARPSSVQPPNSRIPRTESDNSQAAPGLVSGEVGSADESQDSQAAPGLLGDLADLENSTASPQEALALTPDDLPQIAGQLASLGSSFYARFAQLGDLGDLGNSVARLQKAVALTPDGHPQKAGYLANLGSSYYARFERRGDLADLENLVASLQQALALTPDGHPQKAGRLANLGSSYYAHFERLGDLADLENSIANWQQALALTPDSHPQKAGRLANLGSNYYMRFERLGDLADLANSIANWQQALALTLDGHSQKAGYLTNLGSGYSTRFHRLGDLADLNNSIANWQQALALTPGGHPDKPGLLSNLSGSYHTRFERLRDLADLEVSITILEEAVVLTPQGHSSKEGLLADLSQRYIQCEVSLR